MEASVIKFNDEVMETTEEIVNASSGKGLQMAAGIGLGVLVGVIAYRYIVKPMWAKIKTKKEQQKIDAEDFDNVDDDGTIAIVN